MTTASAGPDSRARRAQGLSLNLAIGPSCFVQCTGCYNNFGGTGTHGGLVTQAEIRQFVTAARALGVEQVTLSGGDPLTHPDIIGIVKDIYALGFFVKMDTVGTALLHDARTVFYGKELVRQVDAADLASYVDMIGFPLDGATRRTQEQFRRPGRTRLPTPTHIGSQAGTQTTLFDPTPTAAGRAGRGDANVVTDTMELIAMFNEFGVKVCVNTVVNAKNVHEIELIAESLKPSATRPALWQLFEFQPQGLLGGKNQGKFALPVRDLPVVTPIDIREHPPRLFDVTGVHFSALAEKARKVMADTPVVVNTKSRQDRDKIYFMVNDAGIAWQPTSLGDQKIGHIARDRDLVLSALAQHLSAEVG